MLYVLFLFYKQNIYWKICPVHFEAGGGYWLQGEAALQAQSFRDADPQPVISKKKVAGMD